MANAKTLARRKDFATRHAKLLAGYSTALASMHATANATLQRIITQDYETTRVLCVNLCIAHSPQITLGDTGAVLIDTLRQLAVCVANNVPAYTTDALLNGTVPAQQTAPPSPKRKTSAAVQQTKAPPPVQQTDASEPEPVGTRTPKGRKSSTHHPLPAGTSPAMLAYPQGDWQPACDVFGLPSLRGMVEVFDGSHTMTPPLDPDYIWDVRILQQMIASVNEDVPTQLWLHGERGTGKSTGAEQFAARLGRPFYPVTFDKFTERSTIIGGKGLSGGATVWEDGKLLLALRCPIPPVVFLDEICYAQTDAVSGPLNEIVHPSCRYSVPETGEVIRFDRRTLFIAADNTNGSGDTTGRYHGARTMNRATVDRFGRFVEVTHMSKAQETEAIMNRAKCDKQTASKVVDLMGKLRAKCAAGALADPPSMREAVAFACDLRAALLTPAESFDGTFVGKYPVEAREEMRLAFQSVWVATDTTTPDPSAVTLP